MADMLSNQLVSVRLRPMARIVEAGRTVDLAVPVATECMAVVRCAQRAGGMDYAALATMIFDGDFAWGALLCAEPPPQDGTSQIEAFHISELPRLIERLHELQRAAAS